MERVEKTTGIERIEPWPMGDHMIFATYGVPNIAITASDIFGLLDLSPQKWSELKVRICS